MNPRRTPTVVATLVAMLLVGCDEAPTTPTVISPLFNGSPPSFQIGDIFVPVGGVVRQFRADGTFVGDLDTTHGGHNRGIAFDAAGRLYVVNSVTNTLSVFDLDGRLISADYVPGLAEPFSVVTDTGGHFYIGDLNGIHKFDAAGTLLGTIVAAQVQWLDVAPDEQTLVYSERADRGSCGPGTCSVHRVANTLTGSPTPTVLIPGLSLAWNVRLLPDGGLLVSEHDDIKRFDAAGDPVPPGYGPPHSTVNWYSVNVDVDPAFLWAGVYSSGILYRFGLADGDLRQTIEVGCAQCVWSVAVFGARQLLEPVEAGGPYAGSEGSEIAVSLTDPNPAGTGVSYEWDWGDGDGSSGPELPTAHTYLDNGVFTVRVTAVRGSNRITSATTVQVHNQSPVIEQLLGPVEPLRLGLSATVTAFFTDAGALDAHAASVDWGDGTLAQAVVTEANGQGDAAATHVFSRAGVYPVRISLADDDGGEAAATIEIVVYDESVSVRGNGWIESPPGALRSDPTAHGKLRFALSSRYQGQSAVPDGHAAVQFRAADFQFRSSELEWLVADVQTGFARLRGRGTVNGTGVYEFAISLEDGSPDRFRVIIWSEQSGTVTPWYDGGAVRPLAGGGISMQRH